MMASAEPSPSQIVRDSIATFGLRVLLYAFGLAVAVVVSRALGPVGRGDYYLLVVAASTLVAVGKLGLEQANVYLYSTKGIGSSRLNGQNGLVALVAGGLAATAMIVVPSLQPDLAVPDRLALILASLAIPLNLHIALTAGLQNLAGEVTWQFKAGLAGVLLQLALLGVAAAVRPLSASAVLLVSLIATAAGWLVLVRDPGAITRPAIRLDPRLLVSSLRQSLVLHLAMVLFFLQLRLDTFLVSAIAGLASLGIYSLGVLMAETTYLVTDSLALAILPRQMETALSDAAKLALRGLRINALLGVAMAIGWIVLGMPLIGILFGPDFSGAYAALVALLPGSIAMGMQRMCGPIVLRSGTPVRLVAIYGLALVVNIILNLMWIPTLGIVGAALASSVSYILNAGLIIAWTARVSGPVSFESLVPGRAELVLLAQGAVRVGNTVRSLGRR